MRLFAVLLSGFLAASCLAEAPLPFRTFLEGYTVKADGSRTSGYLPDGTFHKGMGVENPGLVELMSLAYGALKAVENRASEATDLLQTAIARSTLSISEQNQFLELLEKQAVISAEEREALQMLRRANLTAADKAAERTRLASLRLEATEKETLNGLTAKVAETERPGIMKLAHFARRARVQYFLTLELLRELIVRSLREFDLRGYTANEVGRAFFYQADGDDDQRRQRDAEMKKYIVDRAGELYLGALKFLSLRQNPMPGTQIGALVEARPNRVLESGDLEKENEDPHVYLDFAAFQLGTPKAGWNFLTASSEEIPFYRNQAVIPAAEQIAAGYKKFVTESIVEKQAKPSVLQAIRLEDPTPAQKEALAQQILGADTLKQMPQDAAKKSAGLVTFYLYCIGALVDSFNVNAHDSFELMRVAVYTFVAHILDIEGHAGWPRDTKALSLARSYRPFPRALPDYAPLKETLRAVDARRKEIFIEESKSGPLLKAGDHVTEQAKEYGAYSPDALREIFGRDFSYFVFPREAAWDIDKDPRVRPEIASTDWRVDPSTGRATPEIRKFDGSAVNEAYAVQDGDVWGELGTGVGSELRIRSSGAAVPEDRVKPFLTEAASWEVAKEKMVDYWSQMLWSAVSTPKPLDAKTLDSWVNVGRYTVLEKPGTGVHFNGLSHVGLVEVYGDPAYPQLERADFIDAFPNRLRQVWRAHAWGPGHARKMALFRLRAEVGARHLSEFEMNFARTEQALKGELWTALPENLKVNWAGLNQDPAASFAKCREYTALTLPAQLRQAQDEAEFTRLRTEAAPAHRYCQSAFTYRGLQQFKRTVVDRGAERWSGERIVAEMGKQAVEVARAFRNQWPEMAGMGINFDSRFDLMTTHALYGAELVTRTFQLAAGLAVWEESHFQRPTHQWFTGGFPAADSPLAGGLFRIPYTEKDSVYAPQDILYGKGGRERWQAVIVSQRLFFGVNDE